MHLAAKAQADVIVGGDDAGTGIVQAGRHFLGIVADGGDDTETGDNHASHTGQILTIGASPIGRAPAGVKRWRRTVLR